MIQCPQGCATTLRSLYELKLHQLSKCGEFKAFTTIGCEAKFTTKSAMKAHVRHFSGRQGHTCVAGPILEYLDPEAEEVDEEQWEDDQPMNESKDDGDPEAEPQQLDEIEMYKAELQSTNDELAATKARSSSPRQCIQ
jgi:hypothetical protein